MVKIFGVKFSYTSRLFCLDISEAFFRKIELSKFRTNLVRNKLNDAIFIKFTHGLDATQTSRLRRETSQRRQPEVILVASSLPLAVADVNRRRILSSLL